MTCTNHDAPQQYKFRSPPPSRPSTPATRTPLTCLPITVVHRHQTLSHVTLHPAAHCSLSHDMHSITCPFPLHREVQMIYHRWESADFRACDMRGYLILSRILNPRGRYALVDQKSMKWPSKLTPKQLTTEATMNGLQSNWQPKATMKVQQINWQPKGILKGLQSNWQPKATSEELQSNWQPKATMKCLQSYWQPKATLNHYKQRRQRTKVFENIVLYSESPWFESRPGIRLTIFRTVSLFPSSQLLEHPNRNFQPITGRVQLQPS